MAKEKNSMKVGPRAAFKSSTQPKTLLTEIPGSGLQVLAK